MNNLSITYYINLGQTYVDPSGEQPKIVEVGPTKKGWVYNDFEINCWETARLGYVISACDHSIAYGTGDHHYDVVYSNDTSRYVTADEIRQQYDHLIAQAEGEAKHWLEVEKNYLLSKYPQSELFTSATFKLKANATWKGWERKACGCIKVQYRIIYVRVLTKDELSKLIEYRLKTLLKLD
jgi:hypothetical protein